MIVQFWARRRRQYVGPFPTRQETLDSFRATYPHKGPAYAAGAAKNKVMTGYGTHDAYFSLEWHDAAGPITAKV
jgi:hypothetical protein